MPRVTSQDVARAAGVSRTTVSFVLNGRDQHGISAETRQLVAETARRLGYVPSAAGRSLQAGRSNVVVCLVPDLPVTEAFEIMKRQLSAALSHNGYTCLFLEGAGSSTNLSDVWQHVDPAAVVSFAALSRIDAATLNAAEIPSIDNVLHPEGAQIGGLNQQAIGRKQVEHLAAQGHRSIGFAAIADPREATFCRPRIAGAQQACRELGLPEPVVAVMNYTPDTAREALAVWRASSTPVTAVAAFNDLLAIAVLSACRIDGLTVPDDVAVIGVDDLPAARLVMPTLSTISMNLTVPANDLAAQVVALITGNQTTQMDTTNQVLHLVKRQSA